MRIDYSKEALAKDNTTEGQEIYGKVRDLEKRAYNRGVSGFIVDTFLDLMKDEDPEEYFDMSGVLTWICLGMFDSSAKHLEEKVYPNLKSEGSKLACSKLIQMLALADDYPAEYTPMEDTEDD